MAIRITMQDEPTTGQTTYDHPGFDGDDTQHSEDSDKYT